MSSPAFTEEQLKNAVTELAEERYASLPFDGAEPEFSENYQNRKRQFVTMAKDFGTAGNHGRTRRRRHRVLRTVAAVLGILIISFAILMVASPKAYAAVRDWTINIYNKIVDYTFNHSEDDHAVIVCEPAGLPEGFERAETYHSGYYTRKLYKNAETGDYIRFEYRKPTKAQIANIEKRGQKAESVTAANGVPMYFAAGSPNELFWYDKDRNLVFYVESNLSKDALLDCFASVYLRLPLYEPSWLPEGYKEVQRMDHYPYYDIVYAVSDTDLYQHIILYSYCDIAETDGLVIDRLGDKVAAEDVYIDDILCKYYPHTDGIEGGDLIIINEKDKLIYMIESDLEKNLLLRFAESIVCVEKSW